LPSLKQIRVALALELFILVAVVFLDFTDHVPIVLTTLLGSIQVIPSLIRLVSGLTIASLGIVLVFLLTLAYGRVYCSTICPLGTLQDIIIRLSDRMRRRKWYRYKRAPVLAHYTLLGLSGIVAALGSMLVVDLLDPFSNFGRILTNLADPVLILVNNAAGFALRRFGIFALYNIPLLHVQTVAILFAFAFLGLIVYLSYYHGRLFCNLLCPAGALLGLVSRFSIFKIVIAEDRCTDCGFCEMVCKANCIESESRKIDFHACVGCFNCIDSCPPLALKFEGRWRTKRKPEPAIADVPRRAFLGAVVATGSALLLPEKSHEEVTPKSPSFDESRGLPVTPPGSLSKDRFSNLCTACHLCITA
jgi:polyferredoxin